MTISPHRPSKARGDHLVDDNFQKKLEGALQTALPEVIITKYVLMVEYMSNDGRRYYRAAAGPELSPWDTIGLIEYAKQRAIQIVDKRE